MLTNHILIGTIRIEFNWNNSKLKSFEILAARWQKCTDCRLLARVRHLILLTTEYA